MRGSIDRQKLHVNADDIFYYTYPSLGFLKQRIQNEEGTDILTIQPKIKFNPIFNFFYNSRLVYKGQVKKLSPLRFRFELENNKGTLVSTIDQVPIHKKKSIFKEYLIHINENTFNVSFKVADKTFTIFDEQGNIVLQVNLLSSFFEKLLEYRRYRFEVKSSDFPHVIWMAIGAGIIILD